MSVSIKSTKLSEIIRPVMNGFKFLKLHSSYIQNYLREFNIRNPIHITFTEKQSIQVKSDNGMTIVKLTDDLSRKNFNHFLNLLNREIYKNSFQRFKKRIKSYVIQEYDNTHRHHLHTILEIPNHYSVKEFTLLVKQCWYKTDFGDKQVDCYVPKTKEERITWIYYLHKKRTKLDYQDFVDWRNSYSQ